MGVQGKLSVYSHKEQLSSRYLKVMRKKGSLEPRLSVPNFVSQLWRKIRVSLSTIHNANLSHLCVTHNLGVNGTDTVFFSPLTLFVWLHAELNASPVVLQPSLSLCLACCWVFWLFLCYTEYCSHWLGISDILSF